MKRKLEETEILLCRCHSDEHQILIHSNKDDKGLYIVFVKKVCWFNLFRIFAT
jgi:hypothetical protein